MIRPSTEIVRDSEGSFRGDLEGLRGVAVLLVLLYHAKFNFLSGGFVGVDVFYVLSGFFITGLLLREFNVTGKISLTRFYIKRARRLLPAAGIVIFVTSLVSWFVYPVVRVRGIGWDAFAAALNVSNFRFAGQATDYLSYKDDPSPFLHYWSLSVEEQFYLFWPLMLLAIVFYAARKKFSLSRLLSVSLCIVIITSFLAGYYLTGVNQPWAFFMLPTRAWELGVGALLAVLLQKSFDLSGLVKDVITYLGLSLIFLASFTYDKNTAFPGYMAIVPVIGSGLVIFGNSGANGAGYLLNTPILRTIGRWSYSVYLWHWPVLVLTPVYLGRSLRMYESFALVLFSLLLGALSYRFIENPFRYSSFLSKSNRVSLFAIFVLCSVTILSSILLIKYPTAFKATNSGIKAEAVELESNVIEKALDAKLLPSNLKPGLLDARSDVPISYSDGCHLDFTEYVYPECTYGDRDASRSVVLVGDSHAAQWLPLLDDFGTDEGYRVFNFTKSACPTVRGDFKHPSDVGRSYAECQRALSDVVVRVKNIKPSLIIISNNFQFKNSKSEQMEWFTGLDSYLEEINGLGAIKVLLLGDTPHPGFNVPECLSKNINNIDKCNLRYSDSVRDGLNSDLERLAVKYKAYYQGVIDWLCVKNGCPVVLGDVLVYRDDSHISTYAAVKLKDKLVPILNDILQR